MRTLDSSLTCLSIQTADGAINTHNTNKWINWLEHLLNGYLEHNCGTNSDDRSLVNDLHNECVKSSAWLDVMTILELVANVVRKVRGNAANDCSDSGDDPGKW